MNGRNDNSKSEAWQRLKAEWTHDQALRRMEDRGVKYEEETKRDLDHAAKGGTGGGHAADNEHSMESQHRSQSMNNDPAKRGKVNWKGADLRGVNMAGVSLEGADLRASDLRGTNFTGSNLRYADLRGASVQGANFQNASLYGAKMQGVEAAQADFRGADLRLANFGGAYLEGAMMPPPGAQPRHPWPSEIAKANRQKPTGKDDGKVHGNGHQSGHSM